MKTQMNNTDRWMIARWEKLQQMESAMSGARQRYESIFHDIHKQVRTKHPDLDRVDVHFSPKEVKNYGGHVIYSRQGWESNFETWPTGIQLYGITLDELSASSNDALDIYLFFQTKKTDPRIEDLRQLIANEAPKVFENTQFKWHTEDEEDNRTLLWYEMPERKASLLAMIRNGNEQDFIDCIAKHVGIMAGFIPVLDKLMK
ncbi:MAG: hypothetical protein P4N60_21360 [Verrucomicrobiae bacterium]|nr:hypothetical protein [Verrucomicrobiae bacterium]